MTLHLCVCVVDTVPRGVWVCVSYCVCMVIAVPRRGCVCVTVHLCVCGRYSS